MPRKIQKAAAIFFFAFALTMVGNAVGGDGTEVVTVTAVVDHKRALFGYPSAKEGITRGQSHFPESPEIYVPMPIPEPREMEKLGVATQPENKLVSYNLITGEEIIHEAPYTNEDTPISGWVMGGMGDVIISKEKIWEEGTIEKEYGPWPVNFSDLTLITNPEDHPWRVNVKLYMTFASGSYVGSGVLIDPMHVLTAGHCVHDVIHGGTWATSIVVVAAYEDGWRPYGDASAVQLHSWTGWMNDANFDHDIGVIDLDRPIGALTSWHGYGYNNDPSFYTGNTFHSAGYPAESPYNGEYMYYWYGNFDFTESVLGVWYGNEVGFNKRAYGGQSGSGVYYIDSGNRYVYAVISNTVKVSGGPTKCPRITSGKFGNIRDSFIADDTPSTFDLIPLNVTSSPSSITAGDQLSSMSYLIHNYSSASWSGTVNVDVYLSTNDNISTSDTLIQSYSFTTSFSSKSSVQVNVSVPPTIPIDSPEGNYYIGVILNIADHNSGNNDSDGQDASPIHVDVESTPPPAPVISSSTHPNENNWYSNDGPTFNWTTPSDTSGIAGYSYELDHYSSTTPNTTVDTTGNSKSYSNLSNGTWYFHVRAKDNAGNWGSADHYRVKIDDASPPTPTISSSTHPDEDNWYSNDDPTFSWTTPSDTSGIAGYSYELDNSSSTTPDTTVDTTGNSKSYSNLSNGTWYFHVRAKDNAGHWGSADHYKVKIDDIPPDTPSISSDIGNDWQTNNDPSFSWSSSDTGGSGIKGYYYEIDDSTPDNWTTNTSEQSYDVSDGEHTFYVKAEDNAGNKNTAGTYEFKIDTTDPSNPTSYTETHGATDDTWQKDVDDPDFTWSGHSDGTGSGVHGFYVYWGSNSGGTSSYYTATASYDPPSVDSGTYYLRVSTKDNVDWAADWETIFTFKYDGAVPTDPTTVNSPSHSKETWSNDSTIEMQWSVASDTHSGVDGYSYEFSQSDSTIPDETVDTQEESATSDTLSDGDSWYFHIRTRDNAGNWTSTVHTGPYYIDGTKPTNPTSCTESHGAPNDTWQKDIDDPEFTWSGHGDGTGSGVDGFYVYWGSNSNGMSSYYTATASYDPPSVDSGTYYLRVSTKDNIGWTADWETIFTFKYDGTVPTDPTTVDSTSHSLSTWSNDSTIEMQWSGASDTHSQVHGYSYEFTESTSTIPDETVDTQEENAISVSLSDGDNWYFHIRTRDNAGNWTSTVHKGPYYIDGTDPANPISCTETHGATDDTWQKDIDDPEFTWSGHGDGTGSGVDGFYVYWGSNSNGTSSYYITTASYDPPPMDSGTYYLRVRTKDNVDRTADWETIFTLKYDDAVPTNPTSCTETHGATNDTWQKDVDDPDFTWSDALDSHSGIKGYYWYFGTDSNGNPANWTDSAGCDPDFVESGTYCLIVKTEDNAGNISDMIILFTFKYDGIKPIEGIISINNGASETNSLIVELKDLGATEPLSGLDKMRFSNDASTWSPEEPYAGSKTGWDLSAYGGNKNPGLKTVYVKYKDAAGNWSDSYADTIEYHAADLSVRKADDRDPVVPGDQVTYTIMVENPGSYIAENVALTDNVPSQIQSPEYSMDGGENWAEWTGSLELGTIGAEDSKEVLIRGTVTSIGTIINTASVSSSTADPDTNNNSAIEDTIVTSGMDLEIQQTVDNITHNVGDQVVLTITVTNNGPNDATGIQVTDILPSGLSHVSDDSGGNYEPGTGIWNVGNLPATPPNNTTSLTIIATVEQAGEILNIASITDSGETDPDSSNNSSALILNGGTQSDLIIDNVADNPSPNVDDTITFTIRVTNCGIDNATGVEVTDLLTDMTYQSSVSTLGTYEPGTGVWDIGNLNTGGSAALQLTVKVDNTEEIINTAVITNNDQIDPDLTNNQSSEIINQNEVDHPSITDLAICKIVNQSEIAIGDKVVFTVVVRNNGPDDANNVEINDVLPEGLSYVSSETSQGVYNDETGVWDIGTISTSSYKIIDIVAAVIDTNPQTNIASVGNLDKFDPDNGNDSDYAIVTGQAADISVEKKINNEIPRVGENVLFTITVTNEGPNNSTGIQIIDQLPTGLIYQSSTPSQGAYDSDTGVWEIGGLANGTSATLKIIAAIDQSGDITNTAARTASIPTDTNSNNDIGNVTISIHDDNDNDGMPDEWEVENGLNPWIDDSSQDPDEDGLNNLGEYQNGTDPISFDTDNDGIDDGWEVQYGLNPLVDDAAEDPDEDSVSNLDEYLNGSDPNIAEGNHAPNQPVPSSPIKGETYVSLTPDLQTKAFSDPDIGDTHTKTQWQISIADDFSELVLDIMSTEYLTALTVSELVLNINTTYYWRVRFYDNNFIESRWSDTFNFTTIPQDDTDLDADGIPDDQEVDDTVDMDNDGTPDIYQNDIACVNTVVGDGQLCIQHSTNVTSIESMISIDPDTISDTENRPEEMPLGLISFRIEVNNVGDTAVAIVHLSELAPIGARWYKYDSINGWQDYSHHAFFSEDRTSVTLVLEDGGIGDADGTENGIIVDPSGLGGGNQAPIARFTANPTWGEEPLSVSFDATASNDPDGIIESYDWDFGDGNSGSGASTSHEYVLVGIYTVMLTVIDDDGVTDSFAITIIVTDEDEDDIGRCFIAVATYGSPMEPHVKILREFRDRFLIVNTAGKRFVRFYYSYSPPIADFIAENKSLRAFVRVMLLPFVGVSWLALNIGLIPALVFMLMLLILMSVTAIVLFRKRGLRRRRKSKSQEQVSYFRGK